MWWRWPSVLPRHIFFHELYTRCTHFRAESTQKRLFWKSTILVPNEIWTHDLWIRILACYPLHYNTNRQLDTTGGKLYIIEHNIAHYNNNNNLTFLLRLKHAMQTQRRRSLHIGKTHDQHLEAYCREHEQRARVHHGQVQHNTVLLKIWLSGSSHSRLRSSCTTVAL